MSGLRLPTPLSRFKIDGADFGENGADKRIQRAPRRRAKSSAWCAVSKRFFVDISSLPSKEKCQKRKNYSLSKSLNNSLRRQAPLPGLKTLPASGAGPSRMSLTKAAQFLTASVPWNRQKEKPSQSPGNAPFSLRRAILTLPFPEKRTQAHNAPHRGLVCSKTEDASFFAQLLCIDLRYPLIQNRTKPPSLYRKQGCLYSFLAL